MTSIRYAVVWVPARIAAILPFAAVVELMLSASPFWNHTTPPGSTRVTSPIADPMLLVNKTRSPIFSPTAGSLIAGRGQGFGNGFGVTVGGVKVACAPDKAN